MSYILTNLTVELERAPLGMDEACPRFGWRIESDARNVKQTAYRILVKDGQETVWDSGRVESAESQWIEYAGAPLRPRTEYAWEVFSWGNAGENTAASTFETGLMDTDISAWRGAKWVGDSRIGLASRAKSIFNLTLNFVMRGEAVGIIFGKNDPRLLDANRNDYGIAGENYIKYRLDKTGRLSIYRVGYCPEDTADKPIGEKQIEGFSAAEPHSLRIEVTGNNAYAYLDDRRVDEVKKPVPPFMKREGMPDFMTVPRQLNPAGTNDLTTYPLLCDCGFFAEGEAEIVKFAVSNVRPPKADCARIEAATPGPFAEYVKIDRLVIRDVECVCDMSNGGLPILHRDFETKANVKRARLYATARGVYDCTVNGAPISDRRFEPGAGQYDKHLQYQVYDVTGMLRSGGNAIDVRLASGWWNESQTFTLMNYNYWGDRQSLLMMLIVEYADGTEETIVTAPGEWKVRDNGPVRFAGWFYGEHYDARYEDAAPEWRDSVEVATVDFSELNAARAGGPSWPVPSMAQPALKASIGSPVKHIMTLSAKELITPRPGVYVYDMGQNMVGVPEITFRGAAGAEAVIRYGETLYPDLPEYAGNVGMILTENYRDALSIDRYVFKNGDKVTWSPRDTFHGYRYVEISGVAEAPAIDEVKGIVLSSITRLTGSFETSNPLVNRLYSNIRWSQYANFISIPTDCPQRNERMGWAGDAQVFSRTAVYNADVYGFLRRYLECTRDCQLPDGRFADIAPVGGGFGGIEWGSAGIIVTYELFRQYGDKRIIEENYAAMQRYVEFLKAQGTPGLLDNVGPLGDWLATDMSTDNPLLWNSIYYFDATIMAEMAAAIGRSDDAAAYTALADEIRKNWNAAYIDPATGMTRTLKGEINDTQASYAVPLHFGLIDNRERAGKRLAEKSAEVGYTVTTGFVGTGPLCPALSDTGHSDVAYKILTNTKYPSWLYSVTEGATTIWERWNSVTKENGFGGNNSMNSFNHYSLGAVGAWMYGYVLGVRRGAGSWQKFVLQPCCEALERAEGSYESIYGEIKAGWERRDGKVVYRVSVPANTEAEVILPGRHEIIGSGDYEFAW